MINKKYKGIIVSHTHWDRAWYWTFQQYRIRLIETMDQLIAILLNNKNYKCFVLDGQTVVLEDYLEIRPEKEKILKKLISEKKLVVGPWYVLPDEFIVSGEGLIRNLMLGHKIAEKFGKVMKEGYVPDPFGHISQLPQILNGFEIDTFIFSRGVNEEVKEFGTEFFWQSKDGSKVLAVNQRNMYCHLGSWGFKSVWGNFAGQTPNKELAVARMRKEFRTLSKVTNSNTLLFTNGCDHLPPQNEIPELINYTNSKIENLELAHGDFSDYFELLKKENLNLPSYTGELVGNSLNMILSGVLSARMYLKQMNFQTQNLFEKYVEPINIFSVLNGGKDYSDHIWNGWKYILKNHPHDDICGSGIDEIHQDMVHRFEQGDQIGQFVLDFSSKELVHNINTSKVEGKPVIIFNPNNWNITDVLQFELLIDENDKELNTGFSIYDSNGDLIPFKILSKENICKMELFKEAKYNSYRIILLCENIPSIGYRTFYVNPKKTKKVISNDLLCSNNIIENKYFVVKANKNGSIDIYDKINNYNYPNQNIFEDTEDVGDEYTYSFSRFSKTVTTKKSNAIIELIKNDPVSLTFKISIDFNVPECIQNNRQKRSQKFVKMPIISYITLNSNIPRIDIRTTITNTAKDHRVRVLFPTTVFADKSFSDGHFEVISRNTDSGNKPDYKDRFEYYPMKNQKAFVSVSDFEYGLTIANKGLPEYEILNEKDQSIIALTLFRSVGWLSRGDLITRKSNAGPPIQTPEAQCLGENTFEYSIIPHKNDYFESGTYRRAYQFVSPLIGFNAEKSNGILYDCLSLINIESESLIISSIKKSEINNNLVLRLFNISNTKIESKITFFKSIRSASYANLNEKVLKQISKIRKNNILVSVDPNKIITLIISFEK